MILLVDHDDSFIYTLARYVEELGAEPQVIRARDTSLDAVVELRPERIILSPGPGTPDECPLAQAIVRQLGPSVPILGVCLGHQCIAAAYGAVIRRAAVPRHGRTSPVSHDGRGIFSGLPTPLVAARYHSLAMAPHPVPSGLVITARADDGEIMGVRHTMHPVEGVQFHPESVLTEWGHAMLANFLGLGVGALSTREADGVRCGASTAK